MALTAPQKATLKAAILAEPSLAGLPSSGAGDQVIADFFNTTAAPPFIVWRTSVASDEVMLNGFNWTRVDNLSVGKARIWEWLFQFGAIDPSKINIRAGIDAVWVGTQADLDVRAAVYVHCKRSATRFEQLFATGVGSEAVPATLVLESPLSTGDVEVARNS